MAGNFPVRKTNETIDQVPDMLGPELDAEKLSADVNDILNNMGIVKDETKKSEEEKNHLKAFAQQMANIDENEVSIAAKIMADKYPDVMFNALMCQMYDLMKSRDEVNESISSYFNKRNEVFNK